MAEMPEKKTRVSNKALEERVIFLEEKIEELQKEVLSKFDLLKELIDNKIESAKDEFGGGNKYEGIEVGEYLNINEIKEPFIEGGPPVDGLGNPLLFGKKPEKTITRSIP